MGVHETFFKAFIFFSMSLTAAAARQRHFLLKAEGISGAVFTFLLSYCYYHRATRIRSPAQPAAPLHPDHFLLFGSAENTCTWIHKKSGTRFRPRWHARDTQTGHPEHPVGLLMVIFFAAVSPNLIVTLGFFFMYLKTARRELCVSET